MAGNIESKLTGLGVAASDLQVVIQIFRNARTVSELRREKRQWYGTGDVEQYLCPMFRVLYQNNPSVREAVNGECGSLGVPEAVIDQYFTEFGNQPYMILHFQHGEISLEVREGFIAKAQEVMLRSLRSHLGLTEEKPK